MRKSPDNFKSKTTFIIRNYCYLTQLTLNYASLVWWQSRPNRTFVNLPPRSLKHHSIHSPLNRRTFWCGHFWVGIWIRKQTYGWFYDSKIRVCWWNQAYSRINSLNYHLVDSYPSHWSQVPSYPFTITLSQGQVKQWSHQGNRGGHKKVPKNYYAYGVPDEYGFVDSVK